MSRSVQREVKEKVQRLKKIMEYIIAFNIEEITFQTELALIRAFEELGGIAKNLDRFGITFIKKNNDWQKAIALRDKLSHSYETLILEPLIKAIKHVRIMINDLSKLEKECINKINKH